MSENRWDLFVHVVFQASEQLELELGSEGASRAENARKLLHTSRVRELIGQV
jgi:hypothetical protein